MKEEALKLADELDTIKYQNGSNPFKPQADMIRKLVAELDKQGEPVAWAIKTDNDFTEIGFGNEELEDVEETYAMEGWKYEVIPLYTAPQTKPLHEDIVYGLSYKYGIEKGDVLEFARAIEERHGIK